MAKEAYYFSHDANARRDPKILAMRSAYGSEGYGWYFMIIEILREQENFKFKKGKYFLDSLALELNSNKANIKAFLEDCVNEFELFVEDDEYIFSNSLLRRMEKKEEKSKKAKESIEKRWKNQNEKNTNVSKTYNENKKSEYETDTLKESKGKESKGKEIKGKENKVNNNSYSKINEKKHIALSEREYGELISRVIGYGAKDNAQAISYLHTKIDQLNSDKAKGAQFRAPDINILKGMIDKEYRNGKSKIIFLEKEKPKVTLDNSVFGKIADEQEDQLWNLINSRKENEEGS
jgi:hypothetical protein